MNNSKLKENYIYNLIYQILAIIIPFITTPYVSRTLGVTAIGDYSYTTGLVTYFGLIAATGTATFANREIAVHHEDLQQRSKLFWEIFLFRLISTMVAFVGYVIFILSCLPQYRLLFIIQLCTFLSWILDVSWFCQGMENFKITAVRNTLVRIIATVAIFVFVKNPQDLVIYTFINCFAALLGNITMWAYVKKMIILVPRKKLHCFAHTKNIMQLFIPVIAVQIYTVLDKTMLGTFVNTTEVGYYTQADKIIQLATTVISSLISVLLPTMAALSNKDGMNELKKLLEKSLMFIFLLSIPMCIGCLLVIDEFVPFFFGKGYDPVSDIIRIQSILFIVVNIGRLFGTTLVATGQQVKYTYAVISAAILNFVLNAVFLKFFNLGAIGVSISSVLAEFFAAVIQVYFMKELIVLKELAILFKRYLFPSIIMGCAIISIRTFIGIGIIQLFIQVIVGACLYIGILFFMKDELVYSIVNQVKKKIDRSL